MILESPHRYLCLCGKKTYTFGGKTKEKPGDEFDFKDFEKVQNPNEIKITKVLRRIVQSEW